jgi:hypothetical protein
MVLVRRIFNMIYTEDAETQILIYGVSGIQNKKSKLDEFIALFRKSLFKLAVFVL